MNLNKLKIIITSTLVIGACLSSSPTIAFAQNKTESTQEIIQSQSVRLSRC